VSCVDSGENATCIGSNAPTRFPTQGADIGISRNTYQLDAMASGKMSRMMTDFGTGPIGAVSRLGNLHG